MSEFRSQQDHRESLPNVVPDKPKVTFPSLERQDQSNSLLLYGVLNVPGDGRNYLIHVHFISGMSTG
jgi:hypothetical protein